ncbi:hypothetical protein HJC22_25315 [Corallococcus exiguus]|nr:MULTISPECIES: hypothetical protein [Corallococcus]NNC19040.1 hypothetical protein [Corallococcus exiguus]RUO92653.1 hypothetical protein D7Y11_13830 [Corallococcus sp. AB018]
MAEAPLTFYAHQQTRLTALIKRQVDGRGVVPLTLHLKKKGSAETEDARTLDVHLAGPGDVTGLQPGSVILMAPPPYARDAETTKLVHADLRASDLPWRYSPDEKQPIRPWLALLVGTRDEFSVAGNLLTFAPGKAEAVLKAYPFANAERWAHVQETPNGTGEPRRISRLLGLRGQSLDGSSGLLPQTEYIAAIVGTFDEHGKPQWGGPSFPNTLPVYHSWTFWTGEEGDFETLATAIQPREALGLGRVDLRLPRVNDPATGKPLLLSMRGAIGSLESESAPPAPAIADLAALQTPAIDKPPPGHPPRTIIGLPDYGRPWLKDGDLAEWRKNLNGDHRLRGTAGLGGWIGREAQEDLVGAAVQQMGELNAALQRIAQLAMGLEVARTLWKHRLPADTGRRLRVFGPATARMETSAGSVQAATTGADSPLPQAFLTSAAMRVLRRGTARTRGADGKPDGSYRSAGALADAANRVVAPPAPVPASPFDMDGVAAAMDLPRPDDLVVTGPIPPQVWNLSDRFLGRIIDDIWPNNEFIPELRRLLGEDELAGFTCDAMTVLLRILRHGHEPASRAIFCEALLAGRLEAAGLGQGGLGGMAGTDAFSEVPSAQLGCLLSSVAPPIDPRRPRNLGLLVDRIGEMLDPNRPRPPGWRRVESTIQGLRLDILGPQEMPVSIKLPTWTLLNRHDKEWLLPGVGALEKHSVIALKTNPRFIAAFMAGLNSQFLAEMHWRNLPVDRTCTPLLQFWGQLDYATKQRQPDILPINKWDAGRPLGDKSHQWTRPGDPTGREDVVIVFRTDLFRRYPGTLVYLSKRTGDALKLGPDLRAAEGEAPQARTDLGPIYQGELEPDIVFFAFDIDPDTLEQYQLVLDEPPAELRFRNNEPLASGDTNGADVAVKCIDKHTRVAFVGSHLAAQGLRCPDEHTG